jgi:hypothetical protein
MALVELTIGLKAYTLKRFKVIEFSNFKKDNAMRKPIYLIFAATLFLVSSSATAAELEDGFFGIEWKTNLSEVNGFKKVGENLNVTYFVNPERIFTIDDVKIQNVLYGSFKNQFFAVYINIQTIEVFSHLRRGFNSKFGVPRISMGSPEQQTTHQWKSQKTKIKLKTYENQNNMKLALYYTPLSRQVNEAQQEEFALNFRNPMFPINERRMQQAIDFMDEKSSFIGPPR